MQPKRQSLRPFAKDPQLDLHAMTEEYRAFGHRLEPYIADTTRIVWDALDRKRLVVFEGAQGTMLDIDHGTYPFVTSSNPVAGAACLGPGVGREDIGAARAIDDLPPNARAYLDRIAEFLGIPIVLVGVGPGREQVIWTDSAPKRFRPPAPAPPRRAEAA